MPSETTQYNVLMLGPRAAGKTTMLAVMWEHMDEHLEGNIASIRTDLATSRYFADATSHLRQMFNTQDLTVASGIEGNAVNPKRLSLDIHTPNHKHPHLSINFLDYSGDFIASPDQAPDQLKHQIEDAHCCFVIIDIPALIELDGRFHYQRNLPDHVINILRRRIDNIQRGSIPVVLIGTKAEKYIHEGREQEVLENIQKHYARLLKLLQVRQCRTDIGLVETLGTIVFREFQIRTAADGSEFPIYHFQKISPDAKHSPRNITYPLQVILSDAVSQSIDTRRKQNEGFNWLRDIFDRDRELSAVRDHLQQIIARADQ